MARSHPRGFSLLAALMIVVVVTFLVVGAIAFSGSERTAAIQRSRQEVLSGCLQAAKNLFLSQVGALSGNIESVPGEVNRLDAGFVIPDGNSFRTMRIQAAHFGGNVSLTNITKVRQGVGTSSEGVMDISNAPGERAAMFGGYYVISALCRESDTGPEQEIEFLVRVGL